MAVNNANVTGVNFTASLAPFSGETLFTTQTPADTNDSDGPGVDYELGTSFTSDCDRPNYRRPLLESLQ